MLLEMEMLVKSSSSMLGSECIILPNRKNSSKIGSLFKDMEESKKQNKRKTKQNKKG